MLKGINRNNRLFMLGNFLFALSYGLWMNLRQLHLGALGASTIEVGTVLGIVALAGGLLPLPAGLLTDRIGAKRVILMGWCIAAIGTVIAAEATSWSMAGVGFIVFMLVIAANPATTSYVLLNSAGDDQTGQGERVMATVFASWPAAMVFAPALGGLIADQWGITADLWTGVLGFAAAIGVFALSGDTRAPRSEATVRSGSGLLSNRRFVMLAVYFPLALLTLYIGYALVPTYLAEVRNYPTSVIGLLFSIVSVGSLGFNYVIGKVRPQISFMVLVGAVWAGTLFLWQSDHPLLTGAAFALLGAISTMWLLSQTTFGRLVSPQQRGLALGITETLGWGTMALASWLAGQLYNRSAAHELPFVVSVITIVPILIAWVVIEYRGRQAEVTVQPTQERTA